MDPNDRMPRTLILTAIFLCSTVTFAYSQVDPFRGLIGARTADIKAAAEAGDAKAQFRLGKAYESHFSYTNAFVWYGKAARQGNADAQHQLGIMLLNGATGVKQNSEEALRWLSLAANQDQVNAQLSLANVYEHGVHVKQDYSESLKWLTLAERTSPISARSRANSLTLKMTQAQITGGKNRAAAFVPQPPVKVLPALKLQGILGTGEKATAMINGKSLRAGEEAEIKADGETLKVKCIGIDGNNVGVSVAGEPERRLLKLN